MLLARTGNTAAALAIGAAGGALFYAIGAPLPWTLGAMAASALVAISVDRWPMPVAVRSLAIPMVGVLAGSSFSPNSLTLFARMWPALLFVLFYTFLTSVLGYIYFVRVAGFDRTAAYFSATPGGLGELTMIGSMHGASMRTLVLVHSTRVLAIVFIVPLILQAVTHANLSRPQSLGHSASAYDPIDLAVIIMTGIVGTIVGRWVKVPGSVLIATMLISAAVHASGVTAAVPPIWLVAFAQVLIGSVAGARFAGLKWAEFRSTILAAAGWSAILVLCAVGAAALAGRLLDMPFEWILLSIAPGGTTEMIIITFVLGADVAFVATAQVMRIFLVIICAPLFFSSIKAAGRRRAARRSPGPEDEL